MPQTSAPPLDRVGAEVGQGAAAGPLARGCADVPETEFQLTNDDEPHKLAPRRVRVVRQG